MRRLTSHIRPTRPLALALFLGTLLATPAWSLDLLESYRLAMTRDSTWLAAQANARAEKQGIPLAWAQLLPSISASMQRFDNSLVSETKGLKGKVNISRAEYPSETKNLSLRQPVFRPQQIFQLKQATAMGQSADAALDQQGQETAIRVSNAYFEALLAQDRLDFVQAELKAYTAQVAAAERSFKAGVGTRTDIDEATARRDLSLAQLLEAEQNGYTTRHALEVLISQPVSRLARINPAQLALLPLTSDSLEHWMELAGQENPEIQSLIARVEAARQEVYKSRSGHLPTLDLVIQKVDSKSDNPVSPNSAYTNTQLGFQLNVPLFNGGYVFAQTDQALADLERYQHLLDAARKDIAVKVRREFQAVAEGLLKIRAYEQAERSASQLVLSSKKGMQAGTRSQLDILNAEQQHMKARLELSQARYAYVLANLRLHALSNRISETLLERTNAYFQP